MLSTDHYQVLVVQQQQQQQQQHKAVNENSMPTDPNTLVASSVTLEMLQVQLLDDSKFPWHWLPVELARRIFAHLSFEELATASLTCRHFAMLAHDPALYAHLDLSVQSRPHLTADQLELLLRRAGSFLSHIDLSYCKVVNGRHLALIFRDGTSPSSLRFVSLAGCSHLTLDDRMDAIPGGARYIAELDVRDVLYVDDDMLQRVAEQCPYLRVLRVSRGFDISDEGVRAILDGCTRLECLELGNCPQVGVGAFNGNMVLSTLVHMDLAQCRSVDDVTVDRIVARCPNLRRLILDDCLGVTDEGMRALGQLAATLQVLGLARCNQLTDRGIAQLLLCDEDAAVATSVPMHARPLTSLDISGCPWITDRSLDLLPVGYPSLKELYVGECSGLSRRGLDRLREAYPNVLEITR